MCVYVCKSYFGFFPKEPQLVLGFSDRVFGVRFASIVFRGSDSAVRSCALDVLTEVLEGEVTWGLEP